MADRASQIGRCASYAAALAPHIVDGLSITELAKTCGQSKPVVCRDMADMERAGWAQKLDNGRWALSTKIIAISCACDLALKTARERQDDFRRNVKAGAFRLLGE